MTATFFDLYAKKSEDLHWHGRRVSLEIPVSVFSSHHVDSGTRRLLAEMSKAGGEWERALDLGCGYGPIGLFLAAAPGAGRVDAVDRDAVAVEFTRRNAELNGLENVCARGGLDYEGLDREAYDIVATNLPAKAGEPVHRRMLLGAYEYLRPGGRAWAVVVRPLEESVDAILSDEAIRVEHKAAGKEHVVYGYSFLGAVDVPSDAYVRDACVFEWRGVPYDMTVFRGLSEFDSFRWETEWMLDVCAKRIEGSTPRAAAVWDPGQGHGAVLLAKIAPSLERVFVVSRDLLSLRATEGNLAALEAPLEVRCFHAAELGAIGAETALDLILCKLDEQEGMEINQERIRRALAGRPECALIASGRASMIARLESSFGKRGVRRSGVKKKRKGFAAACFVWSGKNAA